ncbi:hypothetical protein RRG08_034711 [Elysia crispata]|uniref:Apple domain-containing protein n=1 Tax=Elysia crispata TaxID=231223 RepID=A0AAE0Z1I0_9GAST|nr:hypothetical protein RRG08_034711 [Elysia crispata]
MVTARVWIWILPSLLGNVLSSQNCHGCYQIKFKLSPGKRVASGGDELSRWYGHNVSNIFCATYCSTYSGCDLYYYNNIASNVCVIFKQKFTFNPHLNLVTEFGGFTGYRDLDFFWIQSPEFWVDRHRLQTKRPDVARKSLAAPSSQSVIGIHGPRVRHEASDNTGRVTELVCCELSFLSPFRPWTPFWFGCSFAVKADSPNMANSGSSLDRILTLRTLRQL